MSYRMLLSLLIIGCFGISAKSQSNKNHCLLTGYELTTGFGALYDLNFKRIRLEDSTGRKNEIAAFWIYDELGRVVIDSLKAMNSFSSFRPYTTVHYVYMNDSVIGITRDTLVAYVNGTMIPDTSGYRINIRLNSDGLPISTYDPTNRNLFASYDKEGRLLSVDEEREMEKKTSFIDNITYVNGDIISYRLTVGNPYMVYCTYYDNDAYPVFGPQRPFALRTSRIFGNAVDIQSFSKHLLKSVTLKFSGSTKTYSYVYKFDKEEKPIEMIRFCDDPVSGLSTSLFRFKYSCD